MPTPRITYCGNVHPAESLDVWLDVVAGPAARVAAAQPAPFGLGVWWNARCAAELAHSEAARERVRGVLATHDLAAWTLNAFPFGDFHSDSVKTDVYTPAWDDPRRARFTLDAATAVAALSPPGEVVPISTLPLGFGAVDLRAAAAELRRVAAELAELESRTGVCCVLALEPEPHCVVETAAQAAAFLEDWVFAPSVGGDLCEAVARRHLGVCVDLCHLFVVGEDVPAALAGLAGRGIAVPKLQLSSCLELRDPAAALDRLLAWDEPRYLHQTCGGPGLRALDLPEVRARRVEFAAAERLRTHFHVPLFWDNPGPLGSTRAEVERVLGVLELPYPLLEVETYTWSVLDRAEVDTDDLVTGLCEELAFARDRLPGSEHPSQPPSP